jgi:hypothetical protein
MVYLNADFRGEVLGEFLGDNFEKFCEKFGSGDE